jgi:hypothetical protein
MARKMSLRVWGFMRFLLTPGKEDDPLSLRN